MRIGELADRTGSTRKTIRYYETIGLLAAPARTAAGYRTYAGDAVQRLQFIRNLHVAGFDLATIGSRLGIADAPSATDRMAKELVRNAVRQVDDRLALVRRLRAELDELARVRP